MSDSTGIVLEKYNVTKTYPKQKQFDCQNEAINKFVAGSLKSQVRKNLSQCYVLIDTNQNDCFIGFYTLSAFSIAGTELSVLSSGSLPSRVPCSRLIMLGVHKDYKKQGLGRLLIQSIIKNTVKASESVGIFGLYLDADMKAYEFYEALGFITLKAKNDPDPTPMFLGIDVMRQACPN